MKKYVDKDKLQEFGQKLNEKQKTIFALKGETVTPEEIAQAVSDWLGENVDPVGSAVVVDSSLSVSGAAADAKVVGDEITDLNSNYNSNYNNVTELNTVNIFNKKTTTRGYLIGYGTGQPVASPNYTISDFIPVKAGKTYYKTGTNTYYCAYYDTNKNYVSMLPNTSVSEITNDGYIRVTVPNANVDSCQIEEGAYASAYQNYGRTAVDERARGVSINGEEIITAWNRGTLNSGIYSGHNYRVANTEVISFNYPIVIDIEDGYRYGIAYFDEENGFLLETEWLTGKTFIPATQRFKIVIACDPEATAIVNVGDLVRRIHFKKNNGIFVNSLYQNINRNVITYGNPIASVNHRGYNVGAPENTLSAFIESKKHGFDYVETDVRWTSDGVPVLLHDETIDRTSNGTGKISEMSFDTVRTYDFGSWFSSDFAGEKIPSFAELLELAKKINLKIVIEVEPVTGLTNEMIKQLINMVDYYCMNDNVIWVSFNINVLWRIMYNSPSAHIAINVNANYWGGLFNHYKILKTPFNVVGFSYQSDKINSTLLNVCKTYKIPLIVWTLDTEEEILELDCAVIAAIVSDNLVASEVYKTYYEIE